MDTVEIRCPVGPKRLFSKLIRDGDRPKHVSGNLLEVSCDDCKKTLRRKGMQVFRVLHRYDLAGELISSHIQSEPTIVD